MLRMFMGLGCAALTTALDGTPTLQCVGRVAHEVTVTGEGDEETIVVTPAPNRDAECTRGRGSQGGSDKEICLGVNTDGTCDVPVASSIPLGDALTCKGCFVGVSTDLYYSLTMTRLHVSDIRLGLRGTKLLGTLSVEAEASAAKQYQGAFTIPVLPLEWTIRITEQLALDIKVSLPTELYYSLKAHTSGHVELGADLEVHLGESYVQYSRGQGWSHKVEQPTLKVTPSSEADYSTQASLTIGARTSLQVEAKNMMWFHVNAVPEAPVRAIVESGTSDPSLAHGCVHASGTFTVSHEAELALTFFDYTIAQRHWGPTTDMETTSEVVKRCVDIHPKAVPDVRI